MTTQVKFPLPSTRVRAMESARDRRHLPCRGGCALGGRLRVPPRRADLFDRCGGLGKPGSLELIGSMSFAVGVDQNETTRNRTPGLNPGFHFALWVPFVDPQPCDVAARIGAPSLCQVSIYVHLLKIFFVVPCWFQNESITIGFFFLILLFQGAKANQSLLAWCSALSCTDLDFTFGEPCSVGCFGKRPLKVYANGPSLSQLVSLPPSLPTCSAGLFARCFALVLVMKVQPVLCQIV